MILVTGGGLFYGNEMTKEIQLTQGKCALVDDADYEWLNQWKWYAFWNGSKWYSARNERVNFKKKMIYLHRFIINAPSGIEVDHVDGDGLNCTRENMRLCTSQQNKYNIGIKSDNTSGYKGVTWNANRSKWQAQIKHGKQYKYLGLFDDLKEAARAYDVAALELHGDFARVNNEI